MIVFKNLELGEFKNHLSFTQFDIRERKTERGRERQHKFTQNFSFANNCFHLVESSSDLQGRV